MVLEEFHGRSLEMDVALGLLLRVQGTIRADLRLVIMSATLDAATVQAHLQPCQVIHSDGRTFPVDVQFDTMGDARRDLRSLPERVAR